VLGWPNGSGGSLQSCSIWVQLPSPALCPEDIEFRTYLKQHIREVTTVSYIKRLTRLSKIANLNNTEQVKNIICSYSSTEAYKELMTNAYDYYVKFHKLSWIKPKFYREDKPIFIPLESELDALVARPRLKMSVSLQFLKETGVDSGEAWKLRWIDINVEKKTVSIIPTKNHNARTLPISNNMLSRLYQIPKSADRVFNLKSLDSFRAGYEDMKNNLAVSQGNPRLAEVAFRSFRHWKATMEYSKTKDILYVKWLLGHKKLENTLIYTHLVSMGSEDYHCKTARTLDEATVLIESGYEYVTEIDGTKLFKKRK
jgi:integrase